MATTRRRRASSTTRRRSAAPRSTARRCTPLKANGTTANGVYDYSGHEHVPDEQLPRTNYWVDVMFSPSTPPGTVTNVSATAGTGSANVSLDRARQRRAAHELQDHALHRLGGADAHDGQGVAAGDQHDDHRPHRRHHLHLHGAGDQRGRQRPGVGALQRGDADHADRAGGAHERDRGRRLGLGQVSWTAASDGGSPITGSTITPYIGTPRRPRCRCRARRPPRWSRASPTARATRSRSRRPTRTGPGPNRRLRTR